MSQPPFLPRLIRRQGNSNPSNMGKRISIQCIICLDTFSHIDNASLGTEQCNHPLCEECVRSYFNNTLKNKRFETFELIQCPASGCAAYYQVSKVLEKFFTKAEREAWWDTAVQSKGYISHKVTCPMEDCKAVFDVDKDDTRQCTFAQCEECNRGLCVVCQTPWHPGQIRFYDDREELKQVLKRAKKNTWCRCPRCGQLVERKNGCSHISCCCGTYFCYRCGRETVICQDACSSWSDQKLLEVRKPMFNIY